MHDDDEVPAKTGAGAQGGGSGGLPTGSVVSLGTSMAAGVGLLAYIGYRADQARGTEPFWTLWGVAAGFAFCGYEVWKALRILGEQEKEAQRRRKAAGAESGCGGGGRPDAR